MKNIVLNDLLKCNIVLTFTYDIGSFSISIKILYSFIFSSVVPLFVNSITLSNKLTSNGIDGFTKFSLNYKLIQLIFIYKKKFFLFFYFFNFLFY